MFDVVSIPFSVLALQNLEATLPKRDTEQAVELSALDASLSMMSKDMYPVVLSITAADLHIYSPSTSTSVRYSRLVSPPFVRNFCARGFGDGFP
jgi:hypothetical protein